MGVSHVHVRREVHGLRPGRDSVDSIPTLDATYPRIHIGALLMLDAPPGDGDLQHMIAHTSVGTAGARHASVGVSAGRVILIAAAFALLPLAVTFAAPQAELWPRWEAHDPASTARVDHSAWAAFLDEYLVDDHPSAVNRVEYAGVSPEDRRSLDGYVAMLEQTAVSELNRDEQLAYWINLYNATTVKLILDNYPVDSIRDIKPGPFASGPWDMDLLEVEGETLTLNDVEHRIIRPIWQDNRIHYAVNCASIGCPNLYPEPLTADNWDRVLEESAHAYTGHARGARFEGGRLVLSSIFDWYVSDFGGTFSGVVEHLVQYVDAETADRLQSYNGRVRYEYDWSLNVP